MACVGQAAQNPSLLGSKQEFTHVEALLNAVLNATCKALAMTAL
jgi:hypothetical protein